MRRLVGLKAPQWLAGLRVRSRERSVVSPVKDHTARGAEHAAEGVSRPGLGQLPRGLAGLDVEGAQNSPARIGWIRTVGAAHVAVTQLKWHVGAREDAAFVVGLHVVKRGERIPGRRIPVGSAVQPGANPVALMRRLLAGGNDGTAFGSKAGSPGQLFGVLATQ